MKSIAILYCAFLIGTSVFGQSGFNNSYLIDTQQTTFLQALYIDHSVFMIGRHIDRETGLVGIGVSQFDTLGNLLNHRTFVDTIEGRPIIPTRRRPMLHTSGGKLVIAGVRVPNNQLFMMKLDKDLELEFLKFYPENYFTYRIGRILEKEKSYYICGQVQTLNYDFDVVLIKFDTNGNLLWEKTFGTRTKHDATSTGGIWNSDSTILFFAGSSTFPHPEDEDDYEGQNWIFEVDTSGQILWQWRSEINPDHGGLRHFERLDDGGWIMVTYPRHPDEQNYVHTSGGIIRTDSTFNTI